jgi:hypothetical protein
MKEFLIFLIVILFCFWINIEVMATNPCSQFSSNPSECSKG